MTNWWCEHAWLPPGIVASRVAVTTDAGRITAIEPDVDPLPGSSILRGLVLPGLANVHSHAFHRALRGRAQAGGGDFWVWRDQMYSVAERLDPDTYLALARATYAEMALAGITCVGEFHYLHHAPGGVRYADPNVMGHALTAAARDAGVRLTLLDTCYLHGEFDEPLRGAQCRFGDGDAVSWAQRVDSLTDASGTDANAAAASVKHGVAIHSVRAMLPDEMAVVVKVAAERTLPLHVHLSEQVAENERCMAKYGRTPTRVLADAGVLRPGSVAVHATHLTDHDSALLAASTTGVCLCPTTERDLADGIGPAGDFAARGIAISLGSDSHAVVDLLEEARGVELDERLATHRRGRFTAAALLDAATVNGHRALGWPDAGELAPGKRADLVALDLQSPRTAGCGATAEAIVFAAAAADITDVVVDGRQIVRDRTHVGIPAIGRALDDAIAALQR
ncbi:MAG: formimidoylglutamate deiminase [Acidothermaceae bacterium]